MHDKLISPDSRVMQPAGTTQVFLVILGLIAFHSLAIGCAVGGSLFGAIGLIVHSLLLGYWVGLGNAPLWIRWGVAGLAFPYFVIGTGMCGRSLPVLDGWLFLQGFAVAILAMGFLVAGYSLLGALRLGRPWWRRYSLWELILSVGSFGVVCSMWRNAFVGSDTPFVLATTEPIVLGLLGVLLVFCSLIGLPWIFHQESNRRFPRFVFRVTLSSCIVVGVPGCLLPAGGLYLVIPPLLATNLAAIDYVTRWAEWPWVAAVDEERHEPGL